MNFIIVLTLLELWSASGTLCTLLLRACLLPLGVILLLKRSLLLNFSASQSYFSVATTTSHGDGTDDVFLETGETFVLSWSGKLPHLCNYKLISRRNRISIRINKYYFSSYKIKVKDKSIPLIRKIKQLVMRWRQF